MPSGSRRGIAAENYGHGSRPEPDVRVLLIKQARRMTSGLLSPSRPTEYHDSLLDREVADIMTPGCVVVSEAASVATPPRRWRPTASTPCLSSAHAMAPHSDGSQIAGCSPGSDVTGPWRATEAVTEQVRAIPAHESLRIGHYALSLSGTTRLLVRSRPNQMPEGVLSDVDLAMAAGR